MTREINMDLNNSQVISADSFKTNGPINSLEMADRSTNMGQLIAEQWCQVTSERMNQCAACKLRFAGLSSFTGMTFFSGKCVIPSGYIPAILPYSHGDFNGHTLCQHRAGM